MRRRPPQLPSYNQSLKDKLVLENNIVHSLHIIYDKKAIITSKNITDYDPKDDVCFFCCKLPIRSFITSLDDPNTPESTLISSELQERNTLSIIYESNELNKLRRMEQKVNFRRGAQMFMEHYCKSSLIKYFKQDSQTGNITLIVAEE